MSKAVMVCTLWLGLAWFSPVSAAEAVWRVVTGPLPPFAFQSEGKPAGFMTELVAEAARRCGGRLEIEFYPWARAVVMAQAGPEALIFPFARTPEREKNVIWVLPLFTQNYVAIAPRGAERMLEGGLAPEARVGVIRGTSLIKDIPALQGRQVSGERDYRDLFRKVDEKTLDVVVGPVAIVLASMKQIGRDPRDYRIGATLVSFDLWVAASSDSRPEHLAPLKAQLRALRDDGTYDRLLKRYGLSEEGGAQSRPGGGSRLSPPRPSLGPAASARIASPE